MTRLLSPTRLTVCLALICYCAAIVLLSLSPWSDVDWAEIVVAVLAGAAIIGLIAHASEAIQLPGEDYAYLIAGFAGFTTTLLYMLGTDDPTGRRLAVILLLLVGTIGGYGAYLSQVEMEQVIKRSRARKRRRDG